MNLEVELESVRLRNPVMNASGCFGIEYADLVDFSQLGAVIPKSIKTIPWPGNPPPRITEVFGGMLNSIGLEGPGIDKFIEEVLPKYLAQDVVVIPSVAGNTMDDYCRIVEKLSKVKEVKMLEINISCPNVKSGLAFGTNPKDTYDLVNALMYLTPQDLMVKLTPNTTNIVEVADAASLGGASVVSMINTVLAAKVDIKKQKFDLKGGYSGPGILPIGVGCVGRVYDFFSKNKEHDGTQIVGVGGIMSGEDAMQYILAGATAVQVGSGNFADPTMMLKVVDGIKNYMAEYKADDINSLVGKAHRTA